MDKIKLLVAIRENINPIFCSTGPRLFFPDCRFALCGYIRQLDQFEEKMKAFRY